LILDFLFSYTVVRKKKENVCISSKPWFSNDCKIARKQYRKLKRRCKIDPSIETKEDMKRAEKEYKKMDANIKLHRKEMSRKIKNLRLFIRLLSISGRLISSSLFVSGALLIFLKN
jgi:light-regulated signal transduction histidine kinase (bacteriophytochrome)